MAWYSQGNLRTAQKAKTLSGKQPLLAGVSEAPTDAESAGGSSPPTFMGSGPSSVWDLRSSVVYTSGDAQQIGVQARSSVAATLSLASVARASLSAEMGGLRSQIDMDISNDFDLAMASIVGDGMPNIEVSRVSVSSRPGDYTLSSGKLEGLAGASPPAFYD